MPGKPTSIRDAVTKISGRTRGIVDFKIGDEVVLTGCRVGEISPGGYSQFVKVRNELLVKKPKSITNKKTRSKNRSTN